LAFAAFKALSSLAFSRGASALPSLILSKNLADPPAVFMLAASPLKLFLAPSALVEAIFAFSATASKFLDAASAELLAFFLMSLKLTPRALRGPFKRRPNAAKAS
jgi:hypothetical protein